MKIWFCTQETTEVDQVDKGLSMVGLFWKKQVGVWPQPRIPNDKTNSRDNRRNDRPALVTCAGVPSGSCRQGGRYDA